MAGDLPFDVNGARAAGFSDADIVKELSQSGKVPFNFDGALKAGHSASDILQEIAPQPSGAGTSFQEGTSEMLSGLGNTANTYGGGVFGLGDKLKQWGADAAPANYTPAPIYDKSGVHWSNIPAWLAKQAPTAAGTVLAASMAPEAAGAAGAVGLGAGANWLMGAGDAAKEAAVKRTGDQNAEPNTADKVRGGLTQAAAAIPAAIPVTKYLPGLGGAVDKVGAAGVTQALKRLPAAAAEQGAGSAASNAVSQIGQTVGTPGGTQIDPTQVADAGIGGAIGGPILAGKATARSALDAAKYSEIGNTPEMRFAASQVANRITQNADGDLQAGNFTSSKAQAVGEDAFKKTSAAIGNELNDAVGDLQSRVTLPVDASNALKSAMSGQRPSEKDYATIQSALGSDPQASNVMNLLRQAHVADIVGDTGSHAGGRFAGGIGGAFNNVLKGEHVSKTLLAGLGGAAFEGGAGHIIAYSPEVLGAAALARLGASRLDRLTDAQTPAWRFVRNFGDGQTPVRLGAPQQQQQAPAAPNPAPLAPMAGPPRPWSSPQATAAILAAKRAAPGTPPAAPTPMSPLAGGPGTTPMLPPEIQATMAARANLAKLAAAQTPAPAAAPAAAPALNPLALPTSITGPAKAIMRGASLAQKQKADTLGQAAANAEVNASPFIDQKLNGASLPTPQAAKAMKTAIGSASALAKLRSDPEAEAEEAAQAKADAAAAKAAAKPVKAAPAQPAPVKVEKVNSTTKVNDEPFPPSSYAHLPAKEASHAILKDAQVGEKTLYHPEGYRASTEARIAGERQAMAAVGREVPGLNIADLTARLEGAPDQGTARAFREHLKTVYPRASASLDQHLSDAEIKRLWKMKGPK